jgi:NAD+ synthase (glutamine-hydrolysing)
VCTCKLPKRIQQITGQNSVPIGEFILDFNDTSIAFEICEEAWIANNRMIDASLDGAEIFLNPSGSHIERGKLSRKIQLIK